MQIAMKYTTVDNSLTRLEHASKCMSAFMTTAYSVSRRLERFDGMGTNCVARLKEAIIDIDKQSSSLEQLYKTGNHILAAYIQCENKLAGYESRSVGSVTQDGWVASAKSTAEEIGEIAQQEVQDGTRQGAVWSYTPDDQTRIDVLSYELGENEFNADLLKITGSTVVTGVVASTVGVTVGSVRGSSKTNFDLFPEAEDSEAWRLLDMGVAATVGATALAFDYNTRIGTDDYNGTVDANVKLLDADVGYDAGLSIGADGISAKVKGEVGVSLAEVEASTSVNIKGVEATATVSAEVGFSAYGECAFDSSSGTLTVGLGLSIGIGGKVNFSIKVPDLGLPWW